MVILGDMNRMVNKVRKLKNDFEKSDKEFSREVEEFADNCSEISEQVDKKVNVIVNIGTTITDIDKEFAKSTGILNRKDQVFLWTAVALQTIRWILLPVLKFDMPTPDIGGRKNANTGEEKKILQLVLDEFEDEDIENVDDGDNIFESKSNFIDKYSYFLKPVPYDAMTGEEAKKLNLPGVKTNPNSQLSGKTHHAATLGHDPVLGYFFGTINIMTYTITFHKIDLQTNEVLLLGDSWVKEIGSQVSFLQTLLDAIQAEMDDGLRIPFAVARHQIHMMTDEGTKMGLPIPFLSAAKQQSLLKKGWNSKELKKIHDSFMKYKKENNETIALQFFIADLINIIIKTLHLLMYDET